MMFMYYRFLSQYHREPKDLDDWFDGLRNIIAENEIMALAYKRD
jgi:hypothetical protein